MIGLWWKRTPRVVYLGSISSRIPPLSNDRSPNTNLLELQHAPGVRGNIRTHHVFSVSLTPLDKERRLIISQLLQEVLHSSSHGQVEKTVGSLVHGLSRRSFLHIDCARAVHTTCLCF